MTRTEIERRIRNVNERYPDVVFNYQDLGDGAFVCIMRGGLIQDDPTTYMDNAVSVLVDGELYNEFIEKYLDNPWVRIIIFGFNSIDLR